MPTQTVDMTGTRDAKLRKNKNKNRKTMPSKVKYAKKRKATRKAENISRWLKLSEEEKAAAIREKEEKKEAKVSAQESTSTEKRSGAPHKTSRTETDSHSAKAYARMKERLEARMSEKKGTAPSPEEWREEVIAT